ncbi:hypothetical protein HO173_003233 [Letharia columbiana]|uniref:Uncharacterized protein n=1 Tax=Letharia columbiana TaxID=112416 RepID=A0A8H6G1I8_9LECA|nr:uncharacterized protein HO173_003233 [Letharia columbiana]KAF6238727.1 hypothetical protein HO173_003233 [Letharia columbiana]
MAELTTFQNLQLQPWVTWPHPDTYKNNKTLKECIGEDEYGEAWVESGLSNATSVKSFSTALTRQGTSSTAPSTAARRNEYDLGLTTLEISYFVTAFGQAEKQLGIVHQRNGEAYLPESVEGLKMRAMMIVKSVQDQNTARQDRMKSKIQKRNAHWQHAMAKAAGLRKEVSHVWTGLDPVDAEKRWLRNRCV